MEGNNQTNRRPRRKYEMKKIENNEDMYASFCKRKNGLFKKASELCTLCSTDIGIIIFSPTNKPYSFFHPNLETFANRFLKKDQPPDPTEQLLEAHTRANVDKLNQRMDELDVQMEIEVKRAKQLDEIGAPKDMFGWLTTPIEEMDEEMVKKLEGWMDDMLLQLENHVNELNINGASSLGVGAKDPGESSSAYVSDQQDFGFGKSLSAGFHPEDFNVGGSALLTLLPPRNFDVGRSSSFVPPAGDSFHVIGSSSSGFLLPRNFEVGGSSSKSSFLAPRNFKVGGTSSSYFLPPRTFDVGGSSSSAFNPPRNFYVGGSSSSTFLPPRNLDVRGTSSSSFRPPRNFDVGGSSSLAFIPPKELNNLGPSSSSINVPLEDHSHVGISSEDLSTTFGTSSSAFDLPSSDHVVNLEPSSPDVVPPEGFSFEDFYYESSSSPGIPPQDNFYSEAVSPSFFLLPPNDHFNYETSSPPPTFPIENYNNYFGATSSTHFPPPQQDSSLCNPPPQDFSVGASSSPIPPKNSNDI